MNALKTPISLEYFSKYRTQIMGVATFMILLCHAVDRGVEMPTIMRWILGFGNYGVDIFLFVSGLGLYYSLLTYKGNIISWYKRRYRRILIPYAIISIPYWLYYCYITDLGFLDFLYYLSTLGFWCEHKGAWFVAFLFPLYLITPILYKNIKTGRKGVIYVIILIILVGLLTLLPNNECPILSNIVFAFKRFPCYILGLFVGNLINTNQNITVFKVVIICVVVYPIYKLLSAVNIDAAWLLFIPIILLITLFIHIVKGGIFDRIFSILGVISLESYLTNIYLGDILSSYQFPSMMIMYLIVVIVGILISLLVSELSKLYFRKIV